MPESPVDETPANFHAPKPAKPEPTLQQRVEAASKIQAFVRAALARKRAVAALAPIQASFESITSSFVCPDVLDFNPKSTSSAKLSYTPNNTSVHAYEDSLMRLLSKLDAVHSGGDKRIRTARKSLAKKIE
ncbi:hypothetical protein SISSUDRAFT_986994, partial [Sistotremastrum suecicum HHB10207 ss-3]